MTDHKVDILAFAAHPDDVELSCSGTLIRHIKAGYKVAVVDLTEGELGTGGSAAERLEEAKRASKIMGIHFRENLGMADGFFQNDREHQRKVIQMIRKYRPEIILCNSPSDRHPDHGRASLLVKDANFYAGLVKIVTDLDDHTQEKWRAKTIYSYIQDYHLHPDIAVNITPFIEQKMEAVQAYSTQFYNPKNTEEKTPISTKAFLDSLYARAREFGRPIGAEFAEGFQVVRFIGTNDLVALQ